MKQYINYVGPLLTDAEYHGLGNPENYLEVRVNESVPFSFYCKMDDECWEKVTEEERSALVKELNEKKIKLSRNDYHYYYYDFYLSSLGALER